MQVVANSAPSRAPARRAARVLGVHLEGPYINPGKLGAQPDAAVSAVLDEVLKYLSIAPIRVVTLAPEIAGHIEIIGEMAARGVRVQLGHSLATYDDAVAALKHGACGFTHLFNAMSPLHHRNPGWGRRLPTPSTRKSSPTCCTSTRARFVLRCARSRACTS